MPILCDILLYNSNDGLGKSNVGVFHSMLWCVSEWHSVDGQTVKDCWRMSAILLSQWDADTNNLDDRTNSKIVEASFVLVGLIAALHLGVDVEGNPVENLTPLEYRNMDAEDDFEGEFYTQELWQLVQDDEQIMDSMELDPFIVECNEVGSKVVKLSDAHQYSKDNLNFMASQGYQIFSIYGLLEMGEAHENIVGIGVKHLTTTTQSDIRTFFVSSVTSFHGLHGTL